MDFKKKVYKFTQKIPKGKVATYKSIAIAVARPQAWRGVALILSKNFDPNIPCHRVVRSDGNLGGYNRGGITTKSKLLRSEGVKVINNRVDLRFFSI
ncbi:MAG: MGMT family protein [Parcubacteria group bacterium]|nr:MGMT family protein [Parcubacteria group bacterium]